MLAMKSVAPRHTLDRIANPDEDVGTLMTTSEGERERGRETPKDGIGKRRRRERGTRPRVSPGRPSIIFYSRKIIRRAAPESA